MVVAVNTNGHAAAEPLVKLEQALIATPMPAQEEPSPPQIPHASRVFPSQSQAPSTMPLPPQTPHSSRTLPSQSQAPSAMPTNATNATLVKNVAVAVAGTVSDSITATNATLVKNVAVAIAGTVSDARTTTHAALIELGARAVIFGCCRVVVAGCFDGATQDFVLVTHPIAVGVVNARTVAVQGWVSLVCARAVIIGCISVVVAGRVVHATTNNIHRSSKGARTVKSN